MTPSWPESNREKCPSGLVALHSPPGSLRWGRSCEWVVALSASSLCSGVSSRQEVIEFPLLKVSISAQPGNPPEMKWTADVCVCVSGGSMKGENSVSGGEREGGNYKDKNCSWSKMFQGRKKPNHQNWKMWHTREKKKIHKFDLRRSQICWIHTWSGLKILSVWLSFEERFCYESTASLACSQCNTAKTDQSEQWCLRKSLPIVPSVTCKKDFLASFFSAPPHCSIEECSKQTFAQININYLNKTITCSSLVPPLWEEIVFKWNDWVKFMLGVRGGCCHP